MTRVNGFSATKPASPATPLGNGRAPVAAPPPTGRSRLSRGRLLRWGLAFLFLLGIAIAIGTAVRSLSTPTRPPIVAPQALTAHGMVQPIARASIATMNGGVVEQLPVQVGQMVDAKQIVASVSLPGQTEYLLAPWRGTVTGINVQLGDTVLPGTVVLTIADLSRYQVETTDVDEYLIGSIRPNQPVTMTVEALDRLELRGVVKSVALQQQSTTAGANYPTVISLEGPNPNLRPGMTVRITFLDQADANR